MKENILIAIGTFVGVLFLIIVVGAFIPENFGITPKNRDINQEIVNKPTEILFVGDIMLDRLVRTTIETQGFEYIFEDIRNIFAGTDLAVGNLEGVVTANPSISQKNYSILRFTFATSTLINLKDLGFEGVSLANNHINDFGSDGYAETINNLNNSEIFYFGSYRNDANLSHKVELNGETICFVGYHAFVNPQGGSVIEEIKTIKPICSLVVVMPHWGIEYKETESPAQREMAYKFINAGADLIIGAHPHVIQPIEIYKGKAIFYSLGNFIFDQDFSLPTRQGLGVRMVLDKQNITFKLIGLEMRRQKLYFPEKENFQARTNVLISRLPADLKEIVDIDGEFTLPR